MSSNPLMMGYKGGDLLLTGAAGQRSGRRPGLCVQAVGGGLGGRRLWFSNESALEEDRRTTGLTASLTAYATMRYTNRRSLYCFLLLPRFAKGSRQLVTDLLRGNWCNGFCANPCSSQLGTSPIPLASM